MTELTLENYLMIQGAVCGVFGAWLLRVEGILSDFCTRITKEETKSDIYHPDGTKIT